MTIDRGDYRLSNRAIIDFPTVALLTGKAMQTSPPHLGEGARRVSAEGWGYCFFIHSAMRCMASSTSSRLPKEVRRK